MGFCFTRGYVNVKSADVHGGRLKRGKLVFISSFWALLIRIQTPSVLVSWGWDGEGGGVKI